MDLDEKVELFNKYFASIFTQDDGKHPEFPQQVDNTTCLSIINFSQKDILDTLLRLPNKASQSPDGYPAIFLKTLANDITLPLSLLYESSMLTGQLPSIWKTAFVIPIFKKGKSSLCQNYRPISLTCMTCKVMESIISKQMKQYFLTNKIITKEQYGFLERRSTCTQLLSTLNLWSQAINNKLLTDTFYLDFSKAFDTVAHKKLIIKLEGYGIKFELLQWISSFLHGRTQSVSIDNVQSQHLQVNSGVPQGSVLGPLLFIVFINDIVNCLEDECHIKLFADDAKIFSSRNHSNSNLQKTLNKIVTWAQIWQLRLAFDKCCVFSIGNTKVTNKSYSLQAIELTRVQQINDLGVLFAPNLKSSLHCAKISAKAKSGSYLIRKSFTSKDPALLLRAFNVYVRPLLETVSPVWSPYLIKDIKMIEKIQRDFTRYVCHAINYHGHSYAERLQYLNMDSLELRRIRNDLTMLYKIVYGLVDLQLDELAHFVANKYTMRGNSMKLKSKLLGKSNLSRYQYINRVIPWWNNLPEHIVLSKTLQTFKHNLIKHDLTNLLQL